MSTYRSIHIDDQSIVLLLSFFLILNCNSKAKNYSSLLTRNEDIKNLKTAVKLKKAYFLTFISHSGCESPLNNIERDSKLNRNKHYFPILPMS